MLTSNFVHFFVISSYPDGAAAFEFAARWHFVGEFLPKLLRILRQRKLSLAVVHHHDVAHSGRSRAGCNAVGVNDNDAQAFARKRRGTGCTDNSSTDNGNVKGHFVFGFRVQALAFIRKEYRLKPAL